MMRLGYLFFLLFSAETVLLFASCGDNAIQKSQTIVGTFEEEKVSLNQEIVRREHADIALIAKRYNWNLLQDSSGFFYEVLNKTAGNFPKTKDRVTIKGKIYLQDGTEVYNENVDGVKEFVINRSDDPVGLHELLKLMREGEKSRAIIPSYLAYGISGDGVEIPALSVLICEIELVKIN